MKTTRSVKMRMLELSFGVLALLVLGSGQARASIIPTLDGPPTLSAGVYTYDYHADLDAAQTIITGSFQTLYDFAGLQGTPTVDEAGWSVSVQNLGLTPPNTNPPDDPAVPNFTITRTGGSLAGPIAPVIHFHAKSLFAQSFNNVFYSAQATKKSDGTATQNVGNVTGPVNAPEPTSLALLGLGIPVGLMLARRRVRGC